MECKLLEVARIGLSNVGILDIPPQAWPEPGQYLPCQKQGEDLSVNLFRVFNGSDLRLSLAPLPESWQPGDMIAAQAPHGRGFTLPRTARRIGLLTFSQSPLRLLNLIGPALAQSAAVSLFSQSPLHDNVLIRLPASVEVAPLSSLADNLGWPDVLFADIQRQEIETLSQFLGERQFSFEGQVLVHTRMPCRGLGECGICAVKTRRGWRLACVEGPVFPLKEVLNVAQ
mgnify:CR=1 FL=1